MTIYTINQIADQVRELMQETGINEYAIERDLGWLRRSTRGSLEMSRRVETALKCKKVDALDDLALIYSYLNGDYVKAQFVFIVSPKIVTNTLRDLFDRFGYDFISIATALNITPDEARQALIDARIIPNVDDTAMPFIMPSF